MATPFELAVEIGYYAGKLWDIATNPAIARGDTPTDYTQILVPKYAEPEKDGKTLLSGEVPLILKGKFEELARIGVPADDDLARNSLGRSLTTLQRVASLADPAKGYTTHFSNLQRPLVVELPEIIAVSKKLELV